MTERLSDFIRLYEPETIFPTEQSGGVVIHRARFYPDAYRDALFTLSGVSRPAFSPQTAQKRRAEYLAGRIVAKNALAALGHADFILTGGAHREPLWPPGIIGSISHSSTQAIATAQRPDRAERSGVGIDVEALISDRPAREISAQIVCDDELRCLDDGGLGFPLSLTVAFSAKESLFKALFPTVKSYMDFSDARLIEINGERGTFTLTLDNPLYANLFAQNAFYGRFLIREGEVMTVIAL